MRIIKRHQRAALPRELVRPVIITVPPQPIARHRDDFPRATSSAYTYSITALRPGGAKYFFMENATPIASKARPDANAAQKNPLAERAAGVFR